MTTIAWDGKTVSADSRATVGGDRIYQAKAQKIIKVKFGVVATCGAFNHRFFEFAAWADKGARGGHFYTKSDDTDYIFFSNIDHTVYIFGKDWRDHSEEPMFATGSGGKFALAAMLAGAKSKKAVEIACKLDPFSGGEVVSFPWKRKV